MILNQCNKEQMFSELYGCAGWDFSFEGNKVGGDWQAALGVNLRSVMSWYTMAGQSKREYPASTASQSPWWEKKKELRSIVTGGGPGVPSEFQKKSVT